ncbi:uncharacterized protein LOC111619894 [Centruroides sculpturatus]|uniref:uncharacterized protein LOC111619894 n=1 Tax=Centruroides sculpturatus TaxID=218467 RepID=UPI000C6CD832|nr:uncharacterized protein LOC111619894 [Centruroides sculpturatus]
MAWQSSSSSIQDKLLYLMATKEMCDVNLIIGHDKVLFTTHTFLLSMFSEVFQKMFLGHTTKKMFNIELPDDNVEAFHVFLEYVYTNKVILRSVDEAISCIQFAEKYSVKHMMDVCLVYLANNISPNSVLKIYEISSAKRKNELKFKCWDYITENASVIVKQDYIKHVTFQTMMDIVSEDSLALKSEVDMYDAVIKWGKENYPNHSTHELREKLNPLLNQVRFLRMTCNQFAGNPTKDQILTMNEKLEIFREISRPTLKNKSEYSSIIDQWRKPRNHCENIETNKLFMFRNFLYALEKYQSNDPNSYLKGIPFYVEHYPPVNKASSKNYKIQFFFYNNKTMIEEQRGSINCRGIIKIRADSSNNLMIERELINIKMGNTSGIVFTSLSVYITLNINTNLYILIKDKTDSRFEGIPSTDNSSRNGFCSYVCSNLNAFVSYIKSKIR